MSQFNVGDRVRLTEDNIAGAPLKHTRGRIGMIVDCPHRSLIADDFGYVFTIVLLTKRHQFVTAGPHQLEHIANR